MPTTPNWKAAFNGPQSNVEAVNASAQVYQNLGTHNFRPVYSGTQIVTYTGGTNSLQLTNSSRSQFDLSQPFVLPGGVTSVGRVSIVMTISGSGGGFLASLYPDNGSGLPDQTQLLAATMVPAEWLTQLIAPTGLANASANVSAVYNGMYGVDNGGGTGTAHPWTAPTAGALGNSQYASVTTSGNFMIMVGDFAGGQVKAGVNTVEYTGGITIGNPIAQQPVPQPTLFGAVTTVPGSVIVAGGTTDNITQTASVWTASFDNVVGTMGTWSSQASLPQALQEAVATSSGNFVYVIGGLSSGNVLNTVYSATVNNGQLTSWTLASRLPVPLKEAVAAVVNGWLVVAGGNTTVAGTTMSNATYYAKVNSDGSIGAWNTGPNLPTAICSFAPGWDFVFTDSSVTVIGGFITGGSTTNAIQTLTIGRGGPADVWALENWISNTIVMVGAFPTGDGTWQIFNTDIPSSIYRTYSVVPRLNMSVPLVATGLTPGNTYHVVLQQQGSASPSDVTVFCDGLAGSSPKLLRQNRHSNTWSPLDNISHLQMNVFDASSGGNVYHTWSDPINTGSSYTNNCATRVSIDSYNDLNLPVMMCTSTLFPNDAMNINPTFVSNLVPWTPTNCTFTQSSAQVHGGFTVSGLMTPTGSQTTTSVASEKIVITPVDPLYNNAQWFSTNGWLYSSTGGVLASISLDYYDVNQVYITTVSQQVTLSAATWTNLVAYYQAPSNAVYAAINVNQSGTLTAANTLYLSNVYLNLSAEVVNSDPNVVTITYDSSRANVVSINDLV